MLKLLVQIKNRLVRLLEGAVILLLGGLVLDVLWQVFSRYVLRNPSSWTDELATLLIIWVALLGSSVAFIRGSHLGVDYFIGRLPERARLGIEVGVYALVGVFATLVLLWGGIKLVSLTLLTGQVSPALGLKMGHVYLALPVSGLFILVFAFEAMAERIATLRHGTGERSDPGH
ncbi:MAG TPA: TRAP transporter small permease [Methylomirabilota bacterium]|nr:TRAP transporter small permease [Methylomirabilota bacterium]